MTVDDNFIYAIVDTNSKNIISEIYEIFNKLGMIVFHVTLN